jgi:hydroxyacylglutathione hydrolase
MIFKQYYLGCLSHASYLIGDEGSRTAVVVDPQRDIDGYLADAQRLGLTIRKVFLTHFHADFVAGHLELRERTGAAIHLGARARADYPFTPMREGDTLEFGAVRLSILDTPGHTPEGISIAVHDLASRDPQPHAVLTGDTLFIGDVGRPDLLASQGISAEELASQMYDSLHEKLMKLPDTTLVYPAHGAGSACGKNMSKETVSTIGAQKQLNWAMQPMPREAFVRALTADPCEMPAYFGFDAQLNRQERPTLEQALRAALVPLEIPMVQRLAAEGATVLDVREPDEYAAGHWIGSVNIGLSGKFASWAGTVLDRERPIVLVAPPGKEQEAAMRLGRIGFDRVAGYLAGGAAAIRARPDLERRSERIDPRQLAAELSGPTPPLVLDVRTRQEWNGKHIAGSLNSPLGNLGGSMRELPRGRRIVVHCQSGYRSSIAASLLEGQGLAPLADLTGGIMAWEQARNPVTTNVS